MSSESVIFSISLYLLQQRALKAYVITVSLLQIFIISFKSLSSIHSVSTAYLAGFTIFSALFCFHYMLLLSFNYNLRFQPLGIKAIRVDDL